MPFGVTSQGFVAKTLSDCKTELETALKAAFGANINLKAPSVFATLVGIIAAREADLWALAQAVFNAWSPDASSGTALDTLCGVTGTLRKAATRSLCSAVALTGTAATVIPQYTVFRVVGTGVRFRTKLQVTLPASVDCESCDFGAIAAPAGSLTVIETPISGLSSVNNPSDAVQGSALEVDATLRTRREVELRASGNAALDAIRSKLLQVSGVTACKMYENTADTTQTVVGLSMPGHSVSAVVLGGTDQAVRDAIMASKSAGIETAGSTTGTSTDSMGLTHTVKFDRPTTVTIYVVVNLKKDPTIWTAGNDAAQQAALKAALVAKTQALWTIGTDVVTRQLINTVFGIAGVMDVTNLYIGTAPAPGTEANIGITGRQLAQLITTNIAVNATDWSETP
jgi:uncharacterized phage protein gp47/JayE